MALYTPGINETTDVARQEAVRFGPYNPQTYPTQPGVSKAGDYAVADMCRYAVVAKKTSTGSLVPYDAAGVDGEDVPVGILASDAGALLAKVDGAGVLLEDMALTYYTGGKFLINDPTGALNLQGYDASVVPNSAGWVLDGNILIVK